MYRKFSPQLAIAAILLFSFQVSTLTAQVGINTTSPSAGSILDVESVDKGIVIPRIDIVNLTTIAPVTGGSTTSLLAYNTNTTTGPGFFYWNGSIWVGIDGERDWKLEGNAGTNPGTTDGDNYIGTSDNQNLVIATNKTPALTIGTNQRLRADSNGSSGAPTYSFTSDTNTGMYRSTVDKLDVVAGAREMVTFHENADNSEVVFNDNSDYTNFKVRTDNDDDAFVIDSSNDNIGIGVAVPVSTTKLEVYSGATKDAVTGYSDNVGGVLGREQPISFGTPVQTISGAGVYANNPLAGYGGMFTQTTGAANVGALGAYSDVWIGTYAYTDDPGNPLSNPPAAYAQRNVTDPLNANTKAAMTAILTRGTTAGNLGQSVGIITQVTSQNEQARGIKATTFSDTGGTPGLTGEFNAGGEFIAANYAGVIQSLSYVGVYWQGTNFKILGTGTVSTVVKDKNKQDRVMFAPEAPEVLFQDFGIGKLVHGTAQISIDPILVENILVDSKHPLKVFIQLEGDCNGVYVTNKSQNGFTVKELQNGTSSIDFSWQIVATRVDTKDNTGRTMSKFQNLRFPKVDLNKKNGRKDAGGNSIVEKVEEKLQSSKK